MRAALLRPAAAVHGFISVFGKRENIADFIGTRSKGDFVRRVRFKRAVYFIVFFPKKIFRFLFETYFFVNERPFFHIEGTDVARNIRAIKHVVSYARFYRVIEGDFPRFFFFLDDFAWLRYVKIAVVVKINRADVRRDIVDGIFRFLRLGVNEFLIIERRGYAHYYQNKQGDKTKND